MKYIILILPFLLISSNAFAFREKVQAWKYNKTLREYRLEWKKYKHWHYTHKVMAKRFNSTLKKKNDLSNEIIPLEKSYNKLKKKFIVLLKQVNKEAPLIPPSGPVVVAFFDNAYIEVKTPLKYNYFSFARQEVSESESDELIKAESELFKEIKKLKEEFKNMQNDYKENKKNLKPLQQMKKKLVKLLPHLQEVWKRINNPKSLELLKMSKMVQCFIPGYHNVHVPFVKSY